MAARTIILTIRDNKVAEQFAMQLVTAQNGGIVEMPQVPEGTTIDAMCARPSLGCTCSGSPSGWARVPRFGWFVCPTCKKPTATVVRNWLANHLNGCTNLLAELFPDKEWTQPSWAIASQTMKKL